MLESELCELDHEEANQVGHFLIEGRFLAQIRHRPTMYLLNDIDVIRK